jgi:DNA phosphorothioation-dependent restriction protein DptG
MVEEIARQRSTEYRLVVRALLMLVMAEGVGNNRLARQRLLDRGVARNIAFDKQMTQRHFPLPARPSGFLEPQFVKGNLEI